MTVGVSRRLPRVTLCVMMALAGARAAYAQSADVCEQAGRGAEQAYALPAGLLLAIGRVESGRWDARFGRVVPWPWAVDAAGQGRLYDSASDAIAAVRALQAATSPNIDVGCFQVNLAYHPNAFATLAQAFDPEANARYAGQFLALLRARFGNWADAVAAYHSATPALGAPYRERVFAAWNGDADRYLVSSAQFTMIAGVRIWGPAPASAAQQVIAIPGATAVRDAAVPAAVAIALPRIVTPGR